MEVMISVCGETPTIGEVFHCGDAYATVVSVDTSGNPVELPFELAPDSPADKSRCAGAADRSVIVCVSPLMTAMLCLIDAAEGNIAIGWCMRKGWSLPLGPVEGNAVAKDSTKML